MSFDPATLPTKFKPHDDNFIRLVGTIPVDANGNAQAISPRASTVARLPSAAASNNATLIGTAGPKSLFQVSGLNAAAAVRYIKFYNKATAPAPTVDVPVLTYALAASVPFVFDIPGLMFPLGLGYVLVTGAADNNNGALTAGDILGLNVLYGA